MNPDVAREITQLVVARGGFVNAHSHLDIAWVASMPLTARLAQEKGLSSAYEVDLLAEAQRFYKLDTLADMVSRNGAQILGIPQ